MILETLVMVCIAGHECVGVGEVEGYDAGPPEAVSTHSEPQEPPQQPATGEPDLTYTAQVIAACESGQRRADGTAVIGSHDWTNVNSQGSSASGAWQFLRGTWQWVAEEIGAEQYAEAKHAPPEVQYEAFKWLKNKEGLIPWNPSRSCWSQMLD